MGWGRPSLPFLACAGVGHGAQRQPGRKAGVVSAAGSRATGQAVEKPSGQVSWASPSQVTCRVGEMELGPRGCTSSAAVIVSPGDRGSKGLFLCSLLLSVIVTVASSVTGFHARVLRGTVHAREACSHHGHVGTRLEHPGAVLSPAALQNLRARRGWPGPRL